MAQPPSSDLLSPSADPIDAHEAQGTAGQGGDANIPSSEYEGWDYPGSDGEGVEPTGQESVGPAGQEGDGGPAGPAYLPPGAITAWGKKHNLLPSRILKYLREEHAEDFGDLRSTSDLAAFGGMTAERAIAYLKAAVEAKALA
jgi:hypothetical protein